MFASGVIAPIHGGVEVSGRNVNVASADEIFFLGQVSSQMLTHIHCRWRDVASKALVKSAGDFVYTSSVESAKFRRHTGEQSVACAVGFAS